MSVVATLTRALCMARLSSPRLMVRRHLGCTSPDGDRFVSWWWQWRGNSMEVSLGAVATGVRTFCMATLSFWGLTLPSHRNSTGPDGVGVAFWRCQSRGNSTEVSISVVATCTRAPCMARLSFPRLMVRSHLSFTGPDGGRVASWWRQWRGNSMEVFMSGVATGVRTFCMASLSFCRLTLPSHRNSTSPGGARVAFWWCQSRGNSTEVFMSVVATLTRALCMARLSSPRLMVRSHLGCTSLDGGRASFWWRKWRGNGMEVFMSGVATGVRTFRMASLGFCRFSVRDTPLLGDWAQLRWPEPLRISEGLILNPAAFPVWPRARCPPLTLVEVLDTIMNRGYLPCRVSHVSHEAPNRE
jgi:hypothetical protein